MGSSFSNYLLSTILFQVKLQLLNCYSLSSCSSSYSFTLVSNGYQMIFLSILALAKSGFRYLKHIVYKHVILLNVDRVKEEKGPSF